VVIKIIFDVADSGTQLISQGLKMIYANLQNQLQVRFCK